MLFCHGKQHASWWHGVILHNNRLSCFAFEAEAYKEKLFCSIKNIWWLKCFKISSDQPVVLQFPSNSNMDDPSSPSSLTESVSAHVATLILVEFSENVFVSLHVLLATALVHTAVADQEHGFFCCYFLKLNTQCFAVIHIQRLLPTSSHRKFTLNHSLGFSS